MITLEEAQNVFDRAKVLRDAAKKFYKLRDREDELFQAGFANSTQRQRDKIRVDCDWQANYVRRVKHDLHVAVVEAKVAGLFPDNYYGEYSIKPSAFHEYRENRKRPVVGGAA